MVELFDKRIDYNDETEVSVGDECFDLSVAEADALEARAKAMQDDVLSKVYDRMEQHQADGFTLGFVEARTIVEDVRREASDGAV